jgi:hypothetical protein
MNEEEKKIIEAINDYIKKKEELGDLGNDFTINFRDTKPLKTLINLIENQQKEIETWKETENDYEHELARKDEEIEKQQKLINIFIHNEAVRENKDFNEIKEKYYECL